MKHIKLFKNDSDYQVFIESEAYIEPNVSYCEDIKDVHYNLPLVPIIASWLGGGEASAILDGVEPYVKPSPMKSDKALTAIKFPSEATELLSLDTTNLTKVDLSDVEYGSQIIQQVEEIVDADVEVIEPLQPMPNNEIWYWTSDGLTAKTTNSYGITSLQTMGLISNEYINGKGVMKFDKDVTSIGQSAFSNCESLTSVTIPDSVTSIGNEAFYRCLKLTNITIPNYITSIGDYAFRKCTSLTSVTIPDSVTSIGTYAFADCVRLTSVTIPDSVSSIGNYAFQSCTGLTSVTIPDSVSSIGNYAFDSCSSLTNVIIGNSVTSIGYKAFWYCLRLISVTIPDSVTSIGDAAFFGCRSLTSVTIPDSVTSIGEEAFSDCWSLESITIPDSVTSIGYRAFDCCRSLTSIIVGENNKKYDSRNNCNALIETATNTLIQGCQNTVIPDSVTSIGNYAFSGCTSLTSVTIPDSVTNIGNSVFYNCSGLTSVTYNGTQSQWNAITKGTNWKNKVPSTCIVHCTDGDVAI